MAKKILNFDLTYSKVIIYMNYKWEKILFVSRTGAVDFFFAPFIL